MMLLWNWYIFPLIYEHDFGREIGDCINGIASLWHPEHFPILQLYLAPNLSRLKGDNKEEKDFGNGILSKFTIVTFVMTFAFLLSGCGGDGDGDGDSDGDDGDGDCWLQWREGWLGVSS